MTEQIESRNASPEVVHNAKRELEIKSGPVRPIVNFSQSEQAKKNYRFQKIWYEQHNWLEYSTSKDAAFCFTCRHFSSLGTFWVYIVITVCLIASFT